MTANSPKKNPGVAGRALVYLALTSVAIAQPILQLYGDNLAVFATAKFDGPRIILFAVVAILVPPLIALTIDLLASLVLRDRARFVHVALVQLGFWAVASLILRGVSFGPWAVDLSVSFLVALAATWMYVNARLLRTWLSFMSVLSPAVGVLFVSTAMPLISPPPVEVVAVANSVPDPVDGGTPANEVSVLWIVLDESPLFPFLNDTGEINARRFPGLARLASTSTWYRNAVGLSSLTVTAVPGMLTGKMPVVGTDPLLSNHPKNLFTLMNGHRSMDAHEVVTALCPREVCSKVSVTGNDDVATANESALEAERAAAAEAVRIAAMRPVPFRSFVQDALVVLGHKILPAGLREALPQIDEAWGGFAGAGGDGGDDRGDAGSDDLSGAQDSVVDTIAPGEVETLENADPNDVGEWKSAGPLTQMPVLESVIARASRASRPTLHFAHVLLPHRPWELTADGRLSSTRYTDVRPFENEESRRDQYQAYLGQMTVVDRQIGLMVDALKRSGNWDRTMVIVTADHGITFEPGAPPRERIDPTRAGVLEDIFRVPLFIKYPDQQIEVVDDCTASSVDILPTVVAATGVDAGWQFDGADLRRSCPARTSRRVVWNGGSIDLATGVPALLSRVARYGQWVDPGGDVDDIYRSGPAGHLVGSPIPSSATVVAEPGLRARLHRRSEFSRIEPVRGGRGVLYVPGDLRATRDFSPAEQGLLVVDGKVVATIPELGGMKKGSTVLFNAQPVPRLLLAPPTTVEVWVVDVTDPAAPVYKRAADGT